MVWRPVPENIPAIREALFREGAIFYWRFFNPREPLFRDFGRPFVPPDPLPEMVRADFYAGRDSSVTW